MRDTPSTRHLNSLFLFCCHPSGLTIHGSGDQPPIHRGDVPRPGGGVAYLLVAVAVLRDDVRRRLHLRAERARGLLQLGTGASVSRLRRCTSVCWFGNTRTCRVPHVDSFGVEVYV